VNKLNTLATSIALGITLALTNLLCALAFALWPGATLDFFAAFMHGLDFATVKSVAPMNPGRVLYGVIGLGVVGLIAVLVFSAVYNVLCVE
jgi:2TM family of unknown function (DUF5676)